MVDKSNDFYKRPFVGYSLRLEMGFSGCLYMTNILFFCTGNCLRSRTAEAVYLSNPYMFARSAGIDSTAWRQVNEEDVKWADLVVVMEYWHRQYMEKCFHVYVEHKRITCLDIPDYYEYMDPSLIAEVTMKMPPYVSGLYQCSNEREWRRGR